METLSDKRISAGTHLDSEDYFVYPEEELKQAVNELKEAQISLWKNYSNGKRPLDVDEFSIMLNKRINQIFGEKLI